MNLKIATILAVCISSVLCGPTTTLNIINNTPFQMTRGDSTNEGLAQWNFPASVKANSQASIDVEFAHADGDENGDDEAASVTFDFAGTGQSITIGAQHNFPEPDGHGLNLYSDLGAQHLDLGFQEGGEINLQLNYGPPHKVSGASRIVITKA